MKIPVTTRKIKTTHLGYQRLWQFIFWLYKLWHLVF